MWEITQKYDFQSRNYISLELGMDTSYCSHNKYLGSFFGGYLWLHLISILLACFSLFINIKYFFSVIHNFNKMKDKFKRNRGMKLKKERKKILKKIAEKNKKATKLAPSINDSRDDLVSKFLLFFSDFYVIDFS